MEDFPELEDDDIMSNATGLPASASTCTLQDGLSSPLELNTPLEVQSPYGALRYNGTNLWYAHTGVDLSYPDGKKVYAAQSGTVQRRYQNGSPTNCATNNSGFGCYIVITKGNEQTLYGHLAAFSVPDGAVVKARQVIGISGHSGNAEGGAPHLHFQFSMTGDVVSNHKNMINPCGRTSNAPDGVVAIVPANVADSTFSSSVALTVSDSGPTRVVALPLSNPVALVDSSLPDEATQPGLRSAFGYPLSMKELQYADESGSFYVVTCGHVVIKDASLEDPRELYIPRGKPVRLTIVPFLNSGPHGFQLISKLHSTGAPCPAPAGPTDAAFNAPGQVIESYYYRTDGRPDTITATAANPAIVSASPDPFGPFECGNPCTLPPPSPTLVNVDIPDPHFKLIAGSRTGATTVTFYSALAREKFATAAVKVRPTPTPAPVPSPLS